MRKLILAIVALGLVVLVALWLVSAPRVIAAMGPVVANLAMLPRSDVQAIAAYLKSLPPLPASAVRPPRAASPR
jgi:hypothetical protein